MTTTRNRWAPQWGPTAVTEKRWQAQVVELLKACGWAVYHTYDSRRSPAGFPDIVAIRGRRLLALELKTLAGEATPEQLAWLRAFEGVEAVDAAVLRPSNDLSALEELVR